MAAGYYDAEGVWIYGEGDNIALFSDLLNLGENSISDQFTADRSRITAVETSLGTRFAAASSTARDAHFGVPANDTQRLALQNSGAECIRTDLGYNESYYATYNSSTNPGGATPAGWYPATGATPNLAVITNTAQNLAATAAAITFGGSLIQDIENNVSFNKSTGTVTIAQPGLYRVTGAFTVNATTSGTKGIYIYKNGATYFSQALTTAVVTPLEISAVLKLVAGDTVNIYGYANVTTATVVGGSSYYTYMAVEYVSPAR